MTSLKLTATIVALIMSTMMLSFVQAGDEYAPSPEVRGKGGEQKKERQLTRHGHP
jgi:hypothetical protein